MSNPELRQTLGEQCLAMVDRALVSQPEVALFELRARCAADAGRADAMVESIFAYAVGTRANLRQWSAAERNARQSEFDALLQAVIAARAAPAVDSHRVEEVRSLLVSVGEQLRSPDATP